MATNRYPKVTVKTEIFLTSGTWTRPSGVDSIDYFLVAGGGGGGGTANTAAAAGGGGGGGVLRGSMPVVGDVTVTIGAGGAGGAGYNYGTAGSDSVCTDSTTTITADGGGGGARRGGDPSNCDGGCGAAGAQVFTKPQANFRSVAVAVAQEETQRIMAHGPVVAGAQVVAEALKGGLDHQHSRV